MIPSEDEIGHIACIPQKNEDGTVNRDWRRARLGCFTSSEISDLMVQSPEEKAYFSYLEKGWEKAIKITKKELPELLASNPGKTEVEIKKEMYQLELSRLYHEFQDNFFSQTAISYMCKVASERNIDARFIEDDTLFDYLTQRTEMFNRDMKWGNEMEPYAREEYQRITGNEVVEVGFVRSAEIDWLGDSPDGLVVDKASGKQIGCIEIKCPRSDTYMKYRYEFSKDKAAGIDPADTLLRLKPDYYWQCQDHCLCNNVEWCDFIIYDNMQIGGIFIVRIKRSVDDIDNIKARVNRANNFIQDELLSYGVN